MSCPGTIASAGAGGPSAPAPLYSDAKVLKGHYDEVSAVAFGAPGVLYSACVDGRVKIWDAMGKHLGR